MTELERRVGNLERDMHSVMETLGEMRLSLERIEATLPHLATKAELARVQAAVGNVGERLDTKPSKGFVIGTVVAIFALCAGIAAATVAAMQYLQGT